MRPRWGRGFVVAVVASNESEDLWWWRSAPKGARSPHLGLSSPSRGRNINTSPLVGEGREGGRAAKPRRRSLQVAVLSALSAPQRPGPRALSAESHRRTREILNRERASFLHPPPATHHLPRGIVGIRPKNKDSARPHNKGYPVKGASVCAGIDSFTIGAEGFRITTYKQPEKLGTSWMPAPRDSIGRSGATHPQGRAEASLRGWVIARSDGGRLWGDRQGTSMGQTGVAQYPPHPRWPPLLPGSLVALGWAARTSPRVAGPASCSRGWPRIALWRWTASTGGCTASAATRR
jgi:hypothetical protein